MDDLATMDGRTSRDRADACHRMMLKAGFPMGPDGPDSVTDILANVMHLCGSLGWDFDAALSSARMHFEAEGVEL